VVKRQKYNVVKTIFSQSYFNKILILLVAFWCGVRQDSTFSILIIVVDEGQ
jgi:hypothetical protein